MTAHCRSCGKRKILRWPGYAPECCSKNCAAYAFLSYAGVGFVECAFCPNCGMPDPDCHCDDEPVVDDED